MNLNDFQNHPDFAGISQEKLDFLMQFSKEPLPGNTQELSKRFMDAMSYARKNELQFTSRESSLLIELLKSKLSKNDQRRADQLIYMMQNLNRQRS